MAIQKQRKDCSRNYADDVQGNGFRTAGIVRCSGFGEQDVAHHRQQSRFERYRDYRPHDATLPQQANGRNGSKSDGRFRWKADISSDSLLTMLKWLGTVAALFIAAGLAINMAAILLSNGSFELTTRNYSLAISISLVGIIATAAALAPNLWRRRSK